MKNFNLKSILATIILFLGVSQTVTAKYYYMGTGINGSQWGNGIALQPSTNGLYEYIEVPQNSAVAFKITESSDGYTNELNNGNVNTTYFGDITFTSEGTGDIKIDACSSKYYIIVYLPSTSCNETEKGIICATKTLPEGCPPSGGGACTLSAAPDEVLSGTNVMFYIESYGDANKTIALSKSDKTNYVAATKVENNGKAFINIESSKLTTYYYITNNPVSWEGVQNDDVKNAKGGEYFVGNDHKSKTAAKTATTTASVSGSTLNISTTANSAKGVYKDLQLYIQYYVDGNFTGVTYSGEEATYCSIQASTSAVSSTYDISALTTGEHTLQTILTDGNIFYIADTDNFSVGSSTTYTVTFDANGHGIAPAKQSVTSGGNATEPTPAPTATGYTFGGWYTEAACTNEYDFNTEVTQNITLYAKWTENKYTVTITAGDGGSVSSTSVSVGIATGATITATPSSGYIFDKWTVSGGAKVTSTSSASTTITATAAGTVTASFILNTVAKYTVVGSSGAVFGECKNTVCDANNMTQQSDGTYTLTKNVTNLSSGDRTFYVVGRNAEGTVVYRYPEGEGTIKFSNAEAGDFVFTFVFNPNNLSATTCNMVMDYSAKEFWYFDENNARNSNGDKWPDTEGKGLVDKWKMTNTATYAYIYVENSSSGNKFKIGYTNWKVDNHLIANDDNIAGSLAGNIGLVADTEQWKNIFIGKLSGQESTYSGSYYVVLYYPNVAPNTENKYQVAAMTELPNAEKYNVTFGVVRETGGGTLTAKSGSSTISSGALVSFATFTATPDVGYAVEGWYSDAEGNNRISAAGTKTTYSQAITKANHTIYVKFTQVRSVYFKNNHNWGEVHIYTFSNNPFNGDYNGEDGNTQDDDHKKGIGPAGALEKAKMENMGNGIYAYQLTNATAFKYIAFTSKEQYGYDNFYNYNDVVYRTDHNDATGLSMYIPDKSESANWVNKNGDNHANYYYNGVWMKPNSTDAGYELVIHTSGVNDHKYAYFKAPTSGGFEFSYDTVLTGGDTYSFFVKNDNNNYFGRGTDAGNTISGTTNDLEMYLWGNGDVGEVSFTAAKTGIYTFTLHLENGRVLIDVLCPEDKYRLVYVEKNGNNIQKFHPSHDIKLHHEATADIPVCDTISMHVRPKVLGTDTADNSNTCLIVLQKYELSSQQWKDIQPINVKDGRFTNGVYNFVVKQDGRSVTIDEKQTHRYKGRYYIRTDASEGGWNNYKQLKNYCYYSEYSRVYCDFDYYYCHWTEEGKNIKYTIACDYSYCVSDTLAQEDHHPHDGFTDANGNFLKNANIRFMWNSFDNTLDRAYIAGRGDNIYLLSELGIYNTDGKTLATSVKLEDQENWVYRADIKASTKSRIKLRVLPYNDAGFYSWFRGKDGDYSEANTEQLIEGKSGNKYSIRIIYDFKTDHLICAWIPDGETITDDDVINADLMIIRKDQGDATQLKFDPSNKKLSSVTTAFGVITMTKEHLEGGEDKSLAPQERGCFWVSFPFDVRLSDVFGCGTYGVDFIIQYYDGESRAKNGCWIDSPTYWRYVEDPTNFTLEKGKGYILVVDYDKILSEQFQHGNTEVSIYFPSANETSMNITGELPTRVDIPPHKCEIQRENRYIYDSNWNLIGVPSWANIDKFGNPRTAYQVPDVEQKFYIGFFYDYNAKTKKWTTSVVNDTTFKSMHAYLVQWAGTIKWKEKSVTGGVYEGESPAQQALQARRYAPAAEGEAEAPEQYTLRLTLNRGEQQLDHTYVRLQEGNVTTDFDLNYDMTKILNDGTNLYSLVGTNLIQCAANVQPLQEDARTISIPLGVVADQDGLYTFSLPDGTEGMNVSIADSESGTVHNLALGDYQTALTKGTYEGRFALEIQPRQEVSTGCEQTDAAGKSLRKVLIDGNLYILRDGKAYTAAGKEL